MLKFFSIFTVCCRSNHVPSSCFLKKHMFYLTGANPDLQIKYKAPKIFDVSLQHKVEEFVTIFYFCEYPYDGKML